MDEKEREERIAQAWVVLEDNRGGDKPWRELIELLGRHHPISVGLCWAKGRGQWSLEPYTSASWLKEGIPSAIGSAMTWRIGPDMVGWTLSLLFEQLGIAILRLREQIAIDPLDETEALAQAVERGDREVAGILADRVQDQWGKPGWLVSRANLLEAFIDNSSYSTDHGCFDYCTGCNCSLDLDTIEHAPGCEVVRAVRERDLLKGKQ